MNETDTPTSGPAFADQFGGWLDAAWAFLENGWGVIWPWLLGSWPYVAGAVGFIASAITIAEVVRRALRRSGPSNQDLQDGLKTLGARLEEKLPSPPGPASGAGGDDLKSAIARDLESLAHSADIRKRAALDRAVDDPEGASRDLMALAERQGKAREKTDAAMRAEQAATYRQAGALAFLSDTHASLAAYEKAVALLPEDLEAQNELGHLYRRLGRLEEARQAYQRVLDGAGDNKANQAVALGNLGNVAFTRGDLDTVEDFFRRSLAIDEELGRKEGMATQLGNLGNVAFTRGDLDTAEDFFRRSLGIDEELGRKEGMAGTLGNLGTVAKVRGDLDAAEDLHRRSLALEEELGRKEGMAAALGNLGLVAQTRGDLAAAEDFLKRSLAISEAEGMKQLSANQLGNLGLVARKRGDLETAEDFLKRSLAISEAEGIKELSANNLGNLGLVASQRGDTAEACRLWARSVALYRDIGVAHMVDRVSGWMRTAGCDGVDGD